MFILAGRYFEVRAKRRAGAALRALLDQGGTDLAVRRRAGSGADRQATVGDEFVSGHPLAGP